MERLNDLARQRLPEGGTGTVGGDVSLPTGELAAEGETVSDEEDALEQLQDAFVQMMEVVREMAEELSTDALKLSGRFRCARTNIEFIQALSDDDDDEDEEEHEHEHVLASESEENVLELEVELVDWYCNCSRKDVRGKMTCQQLNYSSMWMILSVYTRR